jgi:NADH-quinone oxidoreductase subunit M
MGSVPLLSLAIWVPILAGLAVLAAGGEGNARNQKWLALGGAVLGFLVTIPLYTRFDLQSSGFQFVERDVWIERFNVFYHLGWTASRCCSCCSTASSPLVVIAGWSVIEKRVSQYYAAFLIMSGMRTAFRARCAAVLRFRGA